MTVRPKLNMHRGARIVRDNDQHGREQDDFPLIARQEFDCLDTLLLDLVRCVCTGYAQKDISGWDLAFRLADERLGPLDGPGVVARVVALMRAMRLERSNGFGFLALGCHRISDEELLLMTTIRAARMRRQDFFEESASRLATDENPVQIKLAAHALAGVCLRVTQSQGSHHGAAASMLN